MNSLVAKDILQDMGPGMYVSVNWVNIGSGKGLSPGQSWTITWTNADLLATEPWGMTFSEIWIKILMS